MGTEDGFDLDISYIGMKRIRDGGAMVLLMLLFSNENNLEKEHLRDLSLHFEAVEAFSLFIDLFIYLLYELSVPRSFRSALPSPSLLLICSIAFYSVPELQILLPPVYFCILSTCSSPVLVFCIVWRVVQSTYSSIRTALLSSSRSLLPLLLLPFSLSDLYPPIGSKEEEEVRLAVGRKRRREERT